MRGPPLFTSSTSSQGGQVSGTSNFRRGLGPPLAKRQLSCVPVQIYRGFVISPAACAFLRFPPSFSNQAAWGLSLKWLLGAVVASGGCIAACMRHIQNNVMTDPNCVDLKSLKKAKVRKKQTAKLKIAQIKTAKSTGKQPMERSSQV